MRIITSALALVTMLACAYGLVSLEVRAAAPEQQQQRPAAPSPAQGVGAAAEACCKAGDTTPPTELAMKVPPGQLKSPYPDYAALGKTVDLVKEFRLPGCNECHGGNGGGGMCPALSQGVWFWGNTDDVLFRLIALGSKGLEAQGFKRIQYGSVHAPMPPMGFSVKTSGALWKIVAFIRSINPPGTNPPDKIIPGVMAEAPSKGAK